MYTFTVRLQGKDSHGPELQTLVSCQAEMPDIQKYETYDTEESDDIFPIVLGIAWEDSGYGNEKSERRNHQEFLDENGHISGAMNHNGRACSAHTALILPTTLSRLTRIMGAIPAVMADDV